MITKGMILAAGKGTRLGELGTRLPKTLVPIRGEPLLLRALRQFSSAGINQVIINVHHLADQVIRFVADNAPVGMTIEFSQEAELLDTGGGIKRVQRYFSDVDAFVVQNGDIWTDAPLQQLLEAHNSRDQLLATLAVNDRQSSRMLTVSQDAGYSNLYSELVGWEDSKTEKRIVASAQPITKRVSYCGIQVVSTRIFETMKELPDSFWLFDAYFRAINSGAVVATHDISSYLWRDIGTPERIAELEGVLGGK